MSHHRPEPEFPEGADRWPEDVSRREFLSLMGASIALAAGGCGETPHEKIVPYVRQPEEIVPGKPLFYATALEFGGYGIGALVETHMGRPTKVEGNPLHPACPEVLVNREDPTARPGGASLEQNIRFGASDIFSQSAPLGLYDPDRSQTVRRAGEISTWAQFEAALNRAIDAARSRDGQGLWILTPTITSPTLIAQLRALIEELPQARWIAWDPVNADNAQAGALLAFGRPVETIYEFTAGDVILSLDADFLGPTRTGARYTRDFAGARRVWDQSLGEARMSRLYVVETKPSLTGANADHRLGLSREEVAAVAAEIARRLGIDAPPSAELPDSVPERWIEAVVEDLESYRPRQGAAMVVVGEAQPPALHALAHAMNERIGAVGRSVRYIQPVAATPSEDQTQLESLGELVEAMRGSRVDSLLILGGNPVYNAPVDLDFAGALEAVPFSFHLSLYFDETSAETGWHVPRAHELESWGDTRAFDGTASVVQPLIAPLYNGVTPVEFVALLREGQRRSAYDLVREHWRNQSGEDVEFEEFWRRSLHDGVIPETEGADADVSLASPIEFPEEPPRQTGKMALAFSPDAHVWDGRYANLAWLQELPKPLTRLTWDNPALLSEATARRLEVENGDMVRIRGGERSLEIPVWIVPGHPDDSLTLYLGYGRRRGGRVAEGAGFDTYRLRDSQGLWFADADAVEKLGRRFPLASTQMEDNMHGREPVRAGTLDAYNEHPRDPHFMARHHGEPAEGPLPTMYPEREYDGYKWGMAIDLTACTGCNACTLACQAENNIPVVGKDQVMMGREMHWIRVDRYYTVQGEAPRALHQPLACVHCEYAPCEVVCPVAATVHSDEGLNDMVYNRCVGTRYCSNNCPYKVRRFNFFQYAITPDTETPVLKLLQNPDVSVRDRGVMEKCTYCVQRINAARIQAELRDGRIEDGDAMAACQAACPAAAITFGDLNDPRARLSAMRESPLDYGLLEHLNTRPRTTYLARVTNPHPTLTAEDNKKP